MGLKYQVLVTFTKGTEAEHVFFVGTAPAAVPGRPESSIGASRRIELSFVYSIAYPDHVGLEQGRCKEIAQDALTGILDGNFQIKVR
jgi:hypothetical protein